MIYHYRRPMLGYKILPENSPTISVIMPVYNTAKFLPQALDSVLSQSFQDFELICVDDNSKDESLEILRSYKRRYPDKIKIYRNKKNLGVGSASNHAISKARGVLIARMDSDDIMYKNRLAAQAQYLLENPGVIVVGGQVLVVDDSGKLIGRKGFPLSHKKIYELMFNIMSVQQGGAMINRALLPPKFKFYSGNSRVAEEVELFFRLFQYGSFANLKSVVLKYRHHGSSTSLKFPKKTFYKTFRTRFLAVRKYGYRPTIKALVVGFIQLVLVSLLPENSIYPIFSVLRGIKGYKKYFELPDVGVLIRARFGSGYSKGDS